MPSPFEEHRTLANAAESHDRFQSEHQTIYGAFGDGFARGSRWQIS
jgi:hypothetical protein